MNTEIRKLRAENKDLHAEISSYEDENARLRKALEEIKRFTWAWTAHKIAVKALSSPENKNG